MSTKIVIKGKSEKAPFRVEIPQDELVEFLMEVIQKSNEEFDDEFSTSPGGLPTALFTCILPAKAREEAGWSLADGWNLEKARETFETRLERKSGGGVSIEARQAKWDEKAAGLKLLGASEEQIAQFIGKRPTAKA